METDDHLSNLYNKIDNLADRVENRFVTLEKRVGSVEVDVAVIKSNYATKADVVEAKNSVITWVVSAVLLAQALPAVIKMLTG